MNYIVWYSPSAFPTVSTDAALIDGDGDLLLINPGWGYKIIQAGQVNRITSARQHEGEELNAQEREQFNLAQTGKKG